MESSIGLDTLKVSSNARVSCAQGVEGLRGIEMWFAREEEKEGLPLYGELVSP
jgi:hypothetical protein